MASINIKLLSEDAYLFMKTHLDEVTDKIIENEDLTTQKRPSLYGEGENGFNMEDVLNPKGELDLMSLCKELGVTE